jgi:hypothetical protein
VQHPDPGRQAAVGDDAAADLGLLVPKVERRNPCTGPGFVDRRSGDAAIGRSASACSRRRSCGPRSPVFPIGRVAPSRAMKAWGRLPEVLDGLVDPAEGDLRSQDPKEPLGEAVGVRLAEAGRAPPHAPRAPIRGRKSPSMKPLPCRGARRGPRGAARAAAERMTRGHACGGTRLTPCVALGDMPAAGSDAVDPSPSAPTGRAVASGQTGRACARPSRPEGHHPHHTARAADLPASRRHASSALARQMGVRVNRGQLTDNGAGHGRGR